MSLQLLPWFMLKLLDYKRPLHAHLRALLQVMEFCFIENHQFESEFNQLSHSPLILLTPQLAFQVQLSLL